MRDSNRIDAEEEDYLFIKKSQIPRAGKGLYTAIDLFRGEIIATFKGEIIDEEEAQRRADAGNDRYFINMYNGKTMDCQNVESFPKYANDALGMSDSGFKNNSRIILTEKNEVCLEATKNIKAKEEIFCGYGKRYWKKHGV